MLRLPVLCLLLAALFAMGSAQAAPTSEMFASEETFLATWGERAHSVAPGVWTVETAPGIELRVAFGAQGLETDRAALREQVEALELALVLDGATPELEKRAERQRVLLNRLDAVSAAPANKVAINGYLNACFGYEFSLEGVYRTGSTGPEVYAYSLVGLGLDFGPYAPWYPNRYADTEIIARSTTGRCRYAYGTDSATHGGLGFAIASSRVACGSTGSNCAGWRASSWISVDGCADDYRSLTVSSGFLGFCEDIF